MPPLSSVTLNQSAEKGGPTWPARLVELIKLVVQVLDDVLRSIAESCWFAI
jgi:hypothetical protein